jgi:hypothetical protein
MEKNLEKSNSSQNKKCYLALADQQGVRGGFWPSGETRMLKDEQAKEKLAKNRIQIYEQN